MGSSLSDRCLRRSVTPHSSCRMQIITGIDSELREFGFLEAKFPAFSIVERFQSPNDQHRHRTKKVVCEHCECCTMTSYVVLVHISRERVHVRVTESLL